MERRAGTVCSECGLAVLGGDEGCHALHQQLNLRVTADPAIAPVWRLAHDTYCLQHPNRYCVRRSGSAKGLAFHLAGLAWVVEYGGHETGYRALQRWLERVRWETIPWPAVPTERGTLTVADVPTEADGPVVAAAIERWARAAWDAYAPLHEIARGWVADALSV